MMRSINPPGNSSTYNRPAAPNRSSQRQSPASYHQPPSNAGTDAQRQAYPTDIGYYDSRNDFQTQKYSCWT